MWEALGAVLTSSNGVSVLLFLGICLIAAFVLIKSGVVQVHTNSVWIGAADYERNVIRLQLDYVHLHLEAFERSIDKPDGYNEYLGKYIIEQIYDEYVNWVTQNHINKTPEYISIKQERIVYILQKYTVKDEFKTKEFEDFVREDTKQTILTMIQIRENEKEAAKK